MALLQAAGPGAGAPPPEILGQALTSMGVPATPENVERAARAIVQQQQLQQQQQQQPGVAVPQPPSGGAPPQPAANVAKAAVAAVTTPEDAIRALRDVAAASSGPDGAAASTEPMPPDVVGLALRATGLPATSENIKRALREAAGPGAPEPSMDDVVAALEAAANYQPGGLGAGLGTGAGGSASA